MSWVKDYMLEENPLSDKLGRRMERGFRKGGNKENFKDMSPPRGGLQDEEMLTTVE